MTGMSVKRLMTLMTRNPRTGTSLSTSPTQMPRNLTTGMMRWTENGSHPRLTTQSTRYAHAMLPYFFNGINFVNEKYKLAYTANPICFYTKIDNLFVLFVNRENGNQSRLITLTIKENGSTLKLITQNTPQIPTCTNMTTLVPLDLIFGR